MSPRSPPTSPPAFRNGGGDHPQLMGIEEDPRRRRRQRVVHEVGQRPHLLARQPLVVAAEFLDERGQARARLLPWVEHAGRLDRQSWRHHGIYAPGSEAAEACGNVSEVPGREELR